MKKAKHLISGIVWALIGLYILLIILLHIPAFQGYMGKKASEMLSDKFGTEVTVGRINFVIPNRIIVDDVYMKDQSGKEMIRASRASTKIDLIPLFNGKISISSAQLFGLQGTFYKQDAHSQPNFQFALDSLASKDTTRHTPLDLRIGTVVVRHSGFTYDRLDMPRTSGKFNTNHLNVKNISTHLLLPRLTDNGLEATLKRLSLEEASGLTLKELSFKLKADKKRTTLTQLRAMLPQTRLIIDSIGASYEMNNGKIEMATLQYAGRISESKITPADLAFLDRQLSTFGHPLQLKSSFSGTSNMLQLHQVNIESDEGELKLDASGSLSANKRWFANINQLQLSAHTIEFLERNLQVKNIQMPKELVRLGSIAFRGEAGGADKDLSMKGILDTDAGNANLGLGLHQNRFTARIETEGINLQRILDDKKFGQLASRIDIDGDTSLKNLKAVGNVSRFDYNGYSYRNLDIDGDLQGSLFNGHLSIDDPHAQINLDGDFDISAQSPKAKFVAKVRNLVPSALKLTDRFGDARFAMNVDADIAGKSLSTAIGAVNITDFEMHSQQHDYHLDHLFLNAEQTVEGHTIHLQSDFAEADITGDDYFSQASVDATLLKSDWLNVFFGVPVDINKPVKLSASTDKKSNKMALKAKLPNFSLNGILMDYTVDARQEDGKIMTLITWDDRKAKPFKGTLNCTTELFKTPNGKQAIHTVVHESDILVNDTLWHIRPSDIVYTDKHLTVDYFSIDHNNQHLTVYGLATPNKEDSLTVDLQDIDVKYILDLLNFHVVDFSGKASGKAYLSSVFDKLTAHASLNVDDFRFQNGRMGTLNVNANYGKQDNQIDISAYAEDDIGKTLINGYVSIARNYLDLDIKAEKTRLEFVEDFCSSFMRNTDLRGDGNVRLAGFLSGENSINLSGSLIANGKMDITPLNTRYTLHDCKVRMVPNEIYFEQDTITDRDGHIGIVNGAIHHDELTNLTFDFDVNAQNLLAYDFHDYGDATFFGTIYGTGNCQIKGRQGRIDFDVNATPNRGSFIEYNAASPDAISDQGFIEWRDVTDGIQNDFTQRLDSALNHHQPKHAQIPTDIHMNFLFNTRPEDFTLRLLMDKQSGDYIALNGSGSLRASYYNKGVFEMYGNYLIDHGIYKLTIQNVIKKDFQFQPGSTIVFGGDPYNSALNMKAQYTVTGVPLSDLEIGNSFKNNNVRVDCMMNITGTPESPHVEFDLDLPTLGTDMKQMIRSLINSEEEMNQQVIYLLAIGRFYNQRDTRSNEQQSQTSLAMQSLLSGTVSQQINNILSTLTNNSNWNFGANISTGDEGFYNAEYEGILSGRLLNNRLLINGQFGYRDNANTENSSFIGDFDIRYLLFPNGNLAVRVYNQTNDRYFTRNSLNTQGIGVILKRDFNGLKDLFGSGRKK